MDISSTVSTFSMNVSSNLTDHRQKGACLMEDAILMIFTIWDILDKLVVVAVNGGTMIIIYMHRYTMLEIPSNIFISCLTMADLLSVVALPFRIASTYLYYRWAWNINCFLSLIFAYTISVVNTLTLCVIAVDRLIYVVQPLHYHIRMTVKRAVIICIIVWVLSGLYSLITIGIGYKDVYDLGMVTRPCRAGVSVQRVTRRFLSYPFLIFVPITIGSYIKVGMVALKQRNVIAAAESSQAQPAGIDFKITKVMLNVLSVYILCTLVIIVTPRIRNYMYRQENTCGIVFRVTYFIWRINTWLNPIIYAWKSQKFRRYVRAVFNRNLVDASDFNLI